MADVQGLESLKDIHLPEPISWWPLAPGWYVVIALVFLLAAVTVYQVLKRRKREAYKREALNTVALYGQAYLAGANAKETVIKLSALLRQVALVYFQREEVAGLEGQAWLDFLNRTSTQIDFNALEELLLKTPYKPEDTALDLNPLFTAVVAWIKQRGLPCLN